MKEVLLNFLPIMVTGAVSIAALFVTVTNSKKTNYVSNVTSYRLKWIESFREYMSNFCAYSDLIASCEESTCLEDYRKNRMVYYYRIKLHLRKGDINVASINSSISGQETRVLFMAEKVLNNQDELLRQVLMNELVNASQDLVREQWIAVHNESAGLQLGKR